MSKKTTATLVVLALVATVFFGVGAITASAQSVTCANIGSMLTVLGITDATKIAQANAALGCGVMAPSSASYTFTRSLTLGSTGADVTALQNFLISNGGTIPAGATGYFGAQTQAAVKAYQMAKGITPATGYFGPLTMASVNANTLAVVPQGTAPGVVVNGCAAGAAFSATTGAPCASTVAGCAAGAAFSATTGASCSTGAVGTPAATGSTDGSITASISPYVTRSQTLKKGDVKDIYAVDLQAVGGPVTVNRFDVHFNVRPWLVFSQLVLKDSSGKVIATKALNTAADVTEVTTGSDYLVRFDGVNYTVQPGGADSILVVNATVLSSTDKITGQTVTVTLSSNGIRTINERGYTDSVGFTDANTLILSATGSVGDMYSRIDPSTPDTRNETVSVSNTTADEVLGVFGLKEQNQSGTITGINFNLTTSAGATNVFQNVRLYDGSTSYGATSVASSGLTTFTNLNINMTQDSWKSLTLKADVMATTSQFTASSTMVVSSIVGTDTNYNTLTLSNASNVTANNITFIPNGGISITGITSSKGSVTTPQSGVWIAAYPTLGFTVVNNGNNAIYLSAIPASSTPIVTSVNPQASTTVTSVAVSGSTTGDVPGVAYIVQAGSSRTFTINLSVDNTGGTTAGKKVSISQIRYGTGSAAGTGAGQNAQYVVDFGLTNLYVQIP